MKRQQMKYFDSSLFLFFFLLCLKLHCVTVTSSFIFCFNLTRHSGIEKVLHVRLVFFGAASSSVAAAKNFQYENKKNDTTKRIKVKIISSHA